MKSNLLLVVKWMLPDIQLELIGILKLKREQRRRKFAEILLAKLDDTQLELIEVQR